MSSCSIDAALKKVKESPALALAVVQTPLGALSLAFLIFTSVYGMQQLTSAESILDLMKKSAKQVFAFLSPFLERAKAEGTKAFSKDWSWLLVYSLAAIAAGGLLIGFSTDSITWLTAAFGILFAFGVVSLIAKYYSSAVANALISGAVFGVSIFVVYFLVSKSSSYTTGHIVPDFFFVFLVVYILLSFVSLSSVAGTATRKLLLKKLSKK